MSCFLFNCSFGVEYNQIMLLYGEAQRNGLFSHEQFSRYLISTGALLGKNPNTHQLLQYLHHMPVHGEQNQHNQRSMLLQQSPTLQYDKVSFLKKSSFN